MDFLSLFVIIPVITVIAIMLVKNPMQTRLISAIGMGVQLLLAAYLIYAYFAERNAGNMAEMLFMKDVIWYEALNIHYTVGVDGISVAMIALTAIVVFAGVFASWKVDFLPKEFFISLILLSSGVFGFSLARICLR